MLTGYSILLGEYINAEAISYHDCEPFQIVCPMCKEPVFKVARTIEQKSIEYLSHYKKGDSYDTGCSLRVSSISSLDHDKHNSKSRGQKLSYFLSVFLSALERDPFMRYSVDKGLIDTHQQMDRSKVWRKFRDAHFKAYRKGEAEYKGDFKELADIYLDEVSHFDGLLNTGFSSTTQIRIATDMMSLLLTDKGRTNYNALFNHSALYLVQQRPSANETREGLIVIENINNYILGLLSFGKKAGLNLMADMDSTHIYPPYTERPTTYSVKVAAELSHSMIGTLLRLPYFELLKENQNRNARIKSKS